MSRRYRSWGTDSDEYDEEEAFLGESQRSGWRTEDEEYSEYASEDIPMFSRPSSGSTSRVPKNSYRRKMKSCAVRHPVLLGCLVLFLDSFIMLSMMVSDSVIGSSVPELKAEADVSSSQIGLIYSAGTVTSFLSGMIAGRFSNTFGTARMSLFAALTTVVGFLVLIYFPTFLGLVIGRLICGMGFGPSGVVVDVILVRWFDSTGQGRPPSLQLAFGITASAGMIGSFLGFNIVPFVLNWTKENINYLGTEVTLQFALSTIAIFPAFAFFLSVIYSAIDYSASEVLGLEDGMEKEGDLSFIQAIKALPWSYWCVFSILSFNYSSVFVMQLFGVDYLREEFGVGETTAGNYVGAISGCGAVFSLLVGLFLQRFGNILTCLVAGAIAMTAGCLTLALRLLPPFYCMCLIGMALALQETTIWTAVAVVTPENVAGFAYSLLNASCSLLLFVFPLIGGAIKDSTGSYDILALACAGSSIICFICVPIAYCVSPELQDPTRVSHKSYIVEVRTFRKRRNRLRRHSLGSVAELKTLVDNVDEEVFFQTPLPRSLPIDASVVIEKPEVNVDEKLQQATEAMVETGGRMKSRSLPKNFFSKEVATGLALAEASDGIGPVEIPHDEVPDIIEDPSMLVNVWKAEAEAETDQMT